MGWMIRHSSRTPPTAAAGFLCWKRAARSASLRTGQLLAEPFLDLTGQVSGSSEQGLLGLAFAPDFAESGHFFVNYTDENGDTVIARYRVSADDPDRADPSSRSVILEVDQPAANHNGGMLAFGPDGYLYVGMGDGGGARDQYKNGQNPQTLLGKMLRLDVASAGAQAYAVPPDNPWVASDWNGQDVRDEIWALGLRNPWRFSFDRETGDLWIGDVGQGDREEIDYVSAGSRGGINFGWPIMEGTACLDGDTCDQAGLTPPVTDYTHEGNCSVTGGYVYRGGQIPAWNGLYFYGDYCSGKIWTLAADGHGGWTNAEVADTDLTIRPLARTKPASCMWSTLREETYGEL